LDATPKLPRWRFNFARGAVPAGDAFAVSRGISRRGRASGKFRPAARQNQQRNACRFPDGTGGPPRLRTGRRAAAGAGLWDEYSRDINALRNL